MFPIWGDGIQLDLTHEMINICEGHAENHGG